ncbi:hypothetical protein [Lelliottia amnigena]|uniref:hypothetical protein n=1 Tax=Lelliottia amnigena TaxID=61646 RepID=UPI004057C6D5
MDSSNTCAYVGASLLQLILPFLHWEEDRGAYFRAYVNPQHVLGASIKGLPEHIAPDKVTSKITEYAQYFGSRDNACYIWLKPLGLFWAHEGKHRVAFMRAHQKPAIAAWVREASYPAAERLTLIKPTDARDEWLALLDDRYLQVLRRPCVSRLLLEAYGVRMLQWRETGLPDEGAVRREIYQRRLHRHPKTTAERERTLDLYAFSAQLNQQHEEENTCVRRTVLDVVPYRLDWRRYGLAIALPVIIGLPLSAVSDSWLQHTGLVLLGLAAGLTVAMEAIRFSGPKRR